MHDASGQFSGSRCGQGKQPFSLLRLTFSPVNGICFSVCALKSNITEGNRADFATGLSGIKIPAFYLGKNSQAL